MYRHRARMIPDGSSYCRRFRHHFAFRKTNIISSNQGPNNNAVFGDVYGCSFLVAVSQFMQKLACLIGNTHVVDDSPRWLALEAQAVFREALTLAEIGAVDLAETAAEKQNMEGGEGDRT